MDVNINAAVTFGEMLEKNPQAAAFYDRCTPEQRQAILLQLGQISTWSQMRAFIDNLPSSAV